MDKAWSPPCNTPGYPYNRSSNHFRETGGEAHLGKKIQIYLYMYHSLISTNLKAGQNNFSLSLNEIYTLTDEHELYPKTFKSSIPISQNITVSIAKTSWLMLFKEIITTYSENHRRHISTLWAKQIILLIK
jgi:hypothetical protein